MPNKERIDRREALKRTVGACSLLPLIKELQASKLLHGPKHVHPLVPLQEDKETWTPRFFDIQQNELVTQICELIIPETDTPGAKAARVNQYIDFVLSQSDSQTQQAFLKGLHWVDGTSREQYGKNFLQLGEEQQGALLTMISADDNPSAKNEPGVRFFQDIKNRTIQGYYTSEIGLLQELGYQGNTYLAEFPGCQHPEHLNWAPK
ncbi:MAG: gluconate 2-dehydrogenase subunit 3 family protein [Acidobacteriota bacterium]